MKIDFKKISSPVILAQDEHYSYRDPAAWYQDGICYLYFTLVEQCEDGQYFYIGMSKSNDFIHWSEIKKLTPKDRTRNYSSPGNILPFGGKYYLCMQTYCREHGEIYGNDRSRIYMMETEDLEHFKEPRLLRVKGDIPEEEMGRMIDPYLVEDKEEAGKYWCFYKQNGVSYSYSYNLKDWTYAGKTDCGENVCVLVKDKEYYIFHSPEDGIGILRSKDLVEFSDMGYIPIDKSQWDWAKDRLTAGFVLDLTQVPEVGHYIMFYHGDNEEKYVFGASIAMAYSDDLKNFIAFETDRATYPEFGKVYDGDYYKELPFDAYLNGEQEIPQGEGVFDIRDYGGVSKTDRLNTAAFCAAAQACRDAGGGTILVAGGEYCMGTVYLYDNTTLFIAPDSAITASRDCKRFDKAFVRAEGAKNITITGGGKIYGSGEYFVYEPRQKPLLESMKVSHMCLRGTQIKDLPETTQRHAYRQRIRYAEDKYEEGLEAIPRPQFMVWLKECTNVKIENINLEDSMSWTLNLDSCKEVYVHNVVINNNRHVANTDGIDITGSSCVEIDHCFISTADDGIVVKNPNHTNRDMCDIYVHDCTVLTVMNSFKIGTETGRDISKVLVENCIFSLPDIYPGTTSGIAVESADGSVVQNITVRNIKMDKVICPLFICLNMRNRYGFPYSEDKKDKYWGGDISGIIIENIEAVDAEAPSLIFGSLSVKKNGEYIRKPVSDVTIRNFKITYCETEEIVEVPENIQEYLYEYPENNTFGDVGAYGIWLRHADNVLLQDISIIPRSANRRECITYMDSSVTIR